MRLSLLETLRRDKGLSRSALAQEVGVTLSTISRLEAGKSTGDDYTRRKLADFFNVPAHMLTRTSEIVVNDDKLEIRPSDTDAA